MKAWRQRLATLSATLLEDARVLLYIRKDAPIDALIELISALSPAPSISAYPMSGSKCFEKICTRPALGRIKEQSSLIRRQRLRFDTTLQLILSASIVFRSTTV